MAAAMALSALLAEDRDQWISYQVPGRESRHFEAKMQEEEGL